MRGGFAARQDSGITLRFHPSCISRRAKGEEGGASFNPPPLTARSAMPAASALLSRAKFGFLSSTEIATIKAYAQKPRTKTEEKSRSS
jgi:hypothetical protein